jgi:hypothetical protein
LLAVVGTADGSGLARGGTDDDLADMNVGRVIDSKGDRRRVGCGRDRDFAAQIGGGRVADLGKG